jgi:hypothetical protein
VEVEVVAVEVVAVEVEVVAAEARQVVAAEARQVVEVDSQSWPALSRLSAECSSYYVGGLTAHTDARQMVE